MNDSHRSNSVRYTPEYAARHIPELEAKIEKLERHMNRAWQKNGRRLYFEVDESGMIQIRYDVFEELLADTGWKWVPDDQYRQQGSDRYGMTHDDHVAD